MIENISKPKLVKGLSYVLKTSQLEKALLDAGIECHVSLVYLMPQSGGSILEGHYWLPNQKVSYPRVYVRAGFVPSALHFTASEVLMESALPKFIDWLGWIITLPERSPALEEDLYFNATYTEKGLKITDSPGDKIRR
jgi:hypothetical protein